MDTLTRLLEKLPLETVTLERLVYRDRSSPHWICRMINRSGAMGQGKTAHEAVQQLLDKLTENPDLGFYESRKP